MSCKSCKNSDNNIENVKKNKFLIKVILFILTNVALLLMIPLTILLIPYLSYKIIFSKKGLQFNFSKKNKNESKS